MSKPRLLCWFSCGAASAVAAKTSLDRYRDTHDVLIVNCDTRPSEHPDNYRFSQECEQWFGQPIIYIRNDAFQTVDDVFAKHRYMSGIRGARCTTELKKMPRHAFALPDDYHVFGFTADKKERKRTEDFKLRNPELHLLWPLIEAGITKQQCYQLVRAAGIVLPTMYQLGFDNNNCPGCVKASSPWYWAMIRKHFPEVFKRRCEQSRALGVRLVEIKRHVRIFLDELPERDFPKPHRRENLSCGPECGVPGLPTT
jgi:hypothetical protein